jgi:hypothetical protein
VVVVVLMVRVRVTVVVVSKSIVTVVVCIPKVVRESIPIVVVVTIVTVPSTEGVIDIVVADVNDVVVVNEIRKSV